MDYYNYTAPNMVPVANTGAFPLPQQQQTCPLDNRFAWVPSKDTARSMPMAPDKTILFLDENESYAYLRKTDNTGRTVQFRVFQLVEEKEPDPIPLTNAQNNGVSREEFDKSINEIKELISRLNTKPQYSNNKQKAGDH